MIALISGGASVGAIARPLGKSVAFPCGWNSGSVGLVPPVLVPTPPVEVSAKATAGSAHASKHASAARQYRKCAGGPDILSRPPAELADGLALKELARFLERKFAPTNWFPRSGQARIRRRVTVAKRPGRPFLLRLLPYAHLELQFKHPCLASGGKPGAGSACSRWFSQ